MSKFYAEYHEKVFLARIRAGSDQKDWAKALGFSQALVSLVEWGKRDVSEDFLKKLREIAPDFVSIVPTKPEELRLRCRRLGILTGQAARKFDTSDAHYLQVLRGEVEVPDGWWFRLAYWEKQRLIKDLRC